MVELEKPIGNPMEEEEEEKEEEEEASSDSDFEWKTEPTPALTRYLDEYRKYEGFYLTPFDEIFIGGFKPVSPETLEDFRDAAEYAIEQYNTTAEEPLELAEIIRCNWGYGHGLMCYITIAATNSKFYETRVCMRGGVGLYFHFLRPAQHYPTLNPISSPSSSLSPPPSSRSH